MQPNRQALQPDRAKLVALKQRLIDTFTPLLAGKKIVYIDYPLHLNLGDLLIYQGTLELLNMLHSQVMASYSVRNASNLLDRTIPDDWVLLLHGGGNFGDIYPKHQLLREQVVLRFPDNPIIIMPQSVHFNRPEKFTSTSRTFRRHNNLLMFVRDAESLEFMSHFLDVAQVHLAPDMASVLFGRWAWLDVLPQDLLLLRRKDCESVNAVKVDTDAFDWECLYTNRDRLFYKTVGKLSSIERSTKLGLGSAWCWRVFIDQLIQRAVACYQQFGAVDTDRLHGLILAQLLGRPVYMGDNCYQKIHRYVHCWLT